MMKNPTVAAAILCNPVSNISNGNGLYSTVPTRDQAEHRPSIGRSASGALAPASYSCWHSLLRARLRFGVGMSVLILVTDIILRFSWVLRFFHNIFPSGDAFVLCTQFLEVLRRALWNLLRVEWENLKQSGDHISASVRASHGSVQLVSLNDDDKSPFLRGNTSLNKLTNGIRLLSKRMQKREKQEAFCPDA